MILDACHVPRYADAQTFAPSHQETVMRAIVCRTIVVCALYALFPLSFAHAESGADVPPIEEWTAAPCPFEGFDMGHPTKIIAKCHEDPRAPHYRADVLYVENEKGVLIPFSKSWNYQIEHGEYNWDKTRVALLLDNGKWYVGAIGEMLHIQRNHDAGGVVISVTYQFTGEHSSISRTVKIK